ncbi:ABC transporter ATP-binding protein [Spiroplasma endosymbiont of Labia minor]|uniref:ABC transporter ATP-binding protein n=1 Tax=Spiroplasma endosymbiont of Labia minor TaxID=3066305 RepID=UPI0030CAD6A4
MENDNKDYYIKVENVCKFYKNIPVIKNANLTIRSGDRIGIVGPNGAGKTTFVETLAQLRPYESGSIDRIYGIKVGMQLQGSKYPRGFSPWNLVKYYLKTFKIKISTKELKNLFYRLSLETMLYKDISKMSGGQQQRVDLLLALCYRPDILILDELSTGLDIDIKQNVHKLIEDFLQEENKALVLISHNLEEIQMYCNRILFINNGEIILDKTTKEILEETKTVEEYVHLKFKEYNIGQYRMSAKSTIEEKSNEKWEIEWNNYIKKTK